MRKIQYIVACREFLINILYLQKQMFVISIDTVDDNEIQLVRNINNIREKEMVNTLADKKTKLRILSLDGGGIKGLYSAIIIEKLEEKYGPMNQYFDIICGTSTGGIIALALASGIPAKEISKLYKEEGPKIFPYTSRLTRGLAKFKQLFLSSKYENKSLKTALQNVFGNKKIEDCKSTVLIPSVNITNGTTTVFKSDHSPGLGRDSKHLLVDVALATSAAPTYFPIVSFDTMAGYQFVDGGLWANNPSLLGIQEALKFFYNKEESQFSLLSVSTLHQRVEMKNVNARKSILSWRDKLISLMIDLQSNYVHNHLNYMLDSINVKYVRIPSEELNKEEEKHVELDLASKKAIKILTEKGEQAAEKWVNDENVLSFFNTGKERGFTDGRVS